MAKVQLYNEVDLNCLAYYDSMRGCGGANCAPCVEHTDGSKLRYQIPLCTLDTVIRREGRLTNLRFNLSNAVIEWTKSVVTKSLQVIRPEAEYRFYEDAFTGAAMCKADMTVFDAYLQPVDDHVVVEGARAAAILQINFAQLQDGLVYVFIEVPQLLIVTTAPTVKMTPLLLDTTEPLLAAAIRAQTAIPSLQQLCGELVDLRDLDLYDMCLPHQTDQQNEQQQHQT